jgi:hypothetical protein
VRDLQGAEDDAEGVGAGHHGHDAGKGEGGGRRMEIPGEALREEARRQRAEPRQRVPGPQASSPSEPK